jgi:hypothetical protein
MGIQVEFNPDLALRNISEYKAGRRKVEECIPEPLEAGKTYSFLKKGQRNYWFDGEVPLVETAGDGKLSAPLASIVILEATHFRQGEEVFTKGQYKVIDVFADNAIHFNGFSKITS